MSKVPLYTFSLQVGRHVELLNTTTIPNLPKEVWEEQASAQLEEGARRQGGSQEVRSCTGVLRS